MVNSEKPICNWHSSKAKSQTANHKNQISKPNFPGLYLFGAWFLSFGAFIPPLGAGGILLRKDMPYKGATQRKPRPVGQGWYHNHLTV
jgi:hypothetical protein